MDNFRRRRSSLRHTPIDGIITKDRSQKRSDGSINFKRKIPKQSSGHIDNFKREEGLHPTNSPVISSRPNSKINMSNEPRRRSKLHTASQAKKHTKRKLIKRGALAMVLIMAITGGLLFTKGYLKFRKVLKGGGGEAAALQADVDPSSLRVEGDGRFNVLLLGKGGDGHEAPDLTDTILVASIDPVHKETGILSIPRDLWVKPSGDGGYTKINSVYANAKYSVLNGKKISDQAVKAEEAGLSAISKTVEQVIGVPIHRHVIVDFKAFKDGVNAVGGIDLNITKPVYEVLWDPSTRKNYVLDVKAGQQHFDGTRALFYARSRYTSPRGDFDRTERQRAILVGLKQKVFSLSTFANPIKISQLMDAFGDHISTNIGSGEIKKLYELAKTINGDKITSLGLADPPEEQVRTSMVNSLSVVIPKDGIGNYKSIHSFVRNKLRDSYLKKEDAKIMVLNGTSRAGLATSKAEELKSYGYTISQVADAPTKAYKNTVLIDLRGGNKKYTKHYLEKRLKVSALGSLPDNAIVSGDADFVIIVGANETTYGQN